MAAFPLRNGPASGRPEPDGLRASLVVVDGVTRVRGGRLVGDAAGVRGRVEASAGRMREWREGATGA